MNKREAMMMARMMKKAGHRYMVVKRNKKYDIFPMDTVTIEFLNLGLYEVIAYF